ncbi:hypothetical protein BB561_001208 [Smittium simulii]|uniref:Small nuclear ribonucleoprotein E n=1 Tax=Smittium simulii TaxID=133385 RepID=A0A2T9YVP4_9FUNG|nr:hypothetical protein BB561_001208 [Smittium simulii]
MSTKIQKVLVPPISLIFQYMQKKATVEIWLFEKPELRLEGQILGFDEFMNIVLGDCVEVYAKKGVRKEVGRILLKGDNITLIRQLSIPE